MKLLFFCYLFILCSNAFIIKPPNKFLLKPYSFNHNNNNFNITPINYYNRKIFYNNKLNLLSLKKNNDDNNDNYNENIKSLSIIIIKNLILYSYIYYLITLNY